MKKVSMSFILVVLLMGGCKKDSVSTDPGPQATKGSVMQSTAVNGQSATFTVVENSGSDVTLNVKYGTQEITNVQGAITTEGMSDYVYSNGDKSKPFKLVNYSDPVGTTWSYNVGNQKVVRTVTYKSTQDEMPLLALGLYIKIIEVTEVVPSGITVLGKLSGVKQIVWRFNHKFGLVGASLTKNDNSVVNLSLQSTNVIY